MSGWQKVTMRDLMVEFHDGPHATPAPAESGPIYLGIKNITETGMLDFTDIRHIAEGDFPKWTSRVTPQPGDVVFVYEATLHRYALIPEGFRGCLGRRLALIRPDPSVVIPRFLHFLLLGPTWRETVNDRIISGSTVDRISIKDFPGFPIEVPSLDVQQTVVGMLGALDDLIENNRRRIALLEQMARAIYREWFVRFRYPGHEGIPTVNPPLGPIPDGWVRATIGDAAEALTRGISPRYANDGPWTVVNQKCIRGRRVNLEPSRRQERAVPPTKQVQFGDVLINSTGVGTLGRAAMFLGNHPALTVDSHVTIVRAAEPTANPWFGMTLVDRQAEFEALGTGSTGQTELSRQDIGSLDLVMPPPDLCKSFANVVWPLLLAARQLGERNSSLAAIRDLLLPKLVTGQIDVSGLDLGELVESVGA